MKILVTGGTGFIGRHLVPYLLSSGHEITVAALEDKNNSQLEWFGRVKFIPFDVFDINTEIIKKLDHPEAVIHLAWHGLPNYNKLFHFERNLFADYNFLKLLIEGGIKQLLVTGTCFEYGLREGCLSEDMPSNPSNPYSLAKDTLRKFLELLVKQKQITFQWARLFYMYGSGQGANSILSQLDSAIERGDKVFNMSEGEQLRDYLPVEEVASRLSNLFEHKECQGITNICSGKPISIRNLVENHLKKRNTKIELNVGYYPYSEFEPMAFWGNNRKYLEQCTNGL
ncbi:NAD(P)-dependent oxidoreductase [Myxococcota bacterium]|nr:NAD(P)-dependent oxidoreductase [Myxococcota bacterium]MBU1381415.1 NAD(P)-dependent oxidoreductase [Myxococcota bacterium]MBU1498892.1 NAD(P)-dependent oxidoreductase [Myxococcota bacterium]